MIAFSGQKTYGIRKKKEKKLCHFAIIYFAGICKNSFNFERFLVFLQFYKQIMESVFWNYLQNLKLCLVICLFFFSFSKDTWAVTKIRGSKWSGGGVVGNLNNGSRTVGKGYRKFVLSHVYSSFPLFNMSRNYFFVGISTGIWKQKRAGGKQWCSHA